MRRGFLLALAAACAVLGGCVLAVGDDDEFDDYREPATEVLVEREITVGASWCCAQCEAKDDAIACTSCRRDEPQACRAVETTLSCTGTYTESAPGTQNALVRCYD